MYRNLLALNAGDLRALAASIRSARVAAPYSAFAVARCVNVTVAEGVAADLAALASPGGNHEVVANALELLAYSAELARTGSAIDLVLSSPGSNGKVSRDTGVVVREAFSNAERSVLIAGYAVYQGRRVFEALANRMAERPDLEVRLMIDIARPQGDTSASDQIISRFIHRFRNSEWPEGTRCPEVYFDPRSLAEGGQAKKRSALHAKCVVVDRALVFVSSANFTEAAQERNIEVGLLVRSPPLAEQLTGFFDGLIAEGHLEKAL